MDHRIKYVSFIKDIKSIVSDYKEEIGLSDSDKLSSDAIFTLSLYIVNRLHLVEGVIPYERFLYVEETIENDTIGQGEIKW